MGVDNIIAAYTDKLCNRNCVMIVVRGLEVCVACDENF
jgi:hypothetical protein